MIREYQCRAADYIVYRSGAGAKFDALLRGAAGPRPTFPRSLFLLGMLLSAWSHRRTHLRSIFNTLAFEVPMEWQYKWNIRIPSTDEFGNPIEQVISETDLQNISKSIYNKLGYTEEWLPDSEGTPGENEEARKTRRELLYDVVDTMFEATLIPRPTGSSDYAIDSSGIWAEQRYRKRLPEALKEDEEPDFQEISHEFNPTGDEGNTEPLKRARRLGKNNAGLGVKTAKDGRSQWYYGYALHTIARVPAESKDEVRSEPLLAERIRLGNPQDDIVPESLEIIDSVARAGRPVRRLLGDRHYSYKKHDRWLLPLLKRGIEQVVDLRRDDQGFEEWDGMLIAASWAHCPGTPKSLGTILKPGPTEKRKSVWEKFYKQIEERWHYACERRKPYDADGQSRWSCPAACGKIGCPLVAGSIKAAQDLGLPTVANPPTQTPLPAICTQGSVGLQATTDRQKKLMQLSQKEYWGIRKQVALFGRRTFVEGFFGILKSDTAASKKRGSHLYISIQHAVLDISVFALVANMRSLRSWAEETNYVPSAGKEDLFVSDKNPVALGVMHVTPAEYQLLTERRAATAA